MKVKDLLKILIDGQYIEFAYRDDSGYNTSYDIPLYRWGEKYDVQIKQFLDREIEQIYSDFELDDWVGGSDYDYMVVVLKEEKKLS